MNLEQCRVLVVDDDEDILFSMKLLLKSLVGSVTLESDPDNVPGLVAEDCFDVILLDMNFSGDMVAGEEGFSLLRRIRDLDPDAVVIFLTAYGDIDRAVRAIRAGAMDFVLKPWQNEKMLATVSAAWDLRCERRKNARLGLRQEALLKHLDQPFHNLVGKSPKMTALFDLIERVGATEANVLITGENGSGKELVARALHRCSARRDEIMLPIDLGAVPETLFESELFGYVKGAFTDARTDKPGRFELAAGGTLFLDEIGNLNPAQQAKLLTVLERREVMRVGGTKPIPVDVRLVCATNQPLPQLIRENRFRQDLLFRINTVEIQLPPLRERQGDILLLTGYFLEQYTARYKRAPMRLSADAAELLNAYRWPGNVRELQHAVERAVILTRGEVLERRDFQFLIAGQDTPPTSKMTLVEMEREMLRQTLAKFNGNISQAAKELGLTRASLYRRLLKHDLG